MSSAARFLLLFLMAGRSVLASWWDMARLDSHGSLNTLSKQQCDLMAQEFSLTREQQVATCKLHPDLMRAVFSGAKHALHQCRLQYANSTWNCSTAETGSLFGTVLKNGTREAGFVHALFSAALSHQVIRLCSDPRYHGTCHCDRSNALKRYTPSGENPEWSFPFKWHDCSDNIKFGNDFSSTFTTSDDNGNSARELMNRHNSAMGLEVVSTAANLSCYCHGFSGSCALRVCWISAPSMKKIGAELKTAYNRAIHVKRVQVADNPKRKVLLSRNIQERKPEASEMVFLSSSQDFCEPDVRTGSLGTHGRECNASLSHGEGSCENLCCGRGFSRVNLVEEQKCCWFHWCCEVKCTTCRSKRAATICN